jgi:hypothetical protein
VRLAEQVGARHLHVLEVQARRAAAAASHQAVHVLHLDAGTAIDDEGADRLLRWRVPVGIRACVEQEEGTLPAHDEALLAVQQEVVALVFGRAGRAEEIGPAAWFGEALGREDFAREQWHHVTLSARWCRAR